MAGYTNLPFRMLLREIGGVDVTITELVNARSLIEQRSEALSLSRLDPNDSPCAVQLFGNKVDEMAKAAILAEQSGAKRIDINMGCPARKVVANGGGSALLATPEIAVDIAKAVVQAVKVPVSVKMRLGYDAEHIVAPTLARQFQDIGIQSIIIHGRTRTQAFGGTIDIDGIAKTVQAAPNIPVFANGDITTVENAIRVLRETGCAGLAIGRGAFYNPWIFLQIRQYLTSKTNPCEPKFDERFTFMVKHLQMMTQFLPEEIACCQFRKIAPLYTKRMGPSREVNRELCLCRSFTQFLEIMDHYKERRKNFLDENGELLPRFSPIPASTSL